MPTLGLIGAPLLLTSDVAVLLGAWTQVSAPAAVLTIPIAVWEFSIGIYMIVKGFRIPATVEVDGAGVAPLPDVLASA